MNTTTQTAAVVELKARDLGAQGEISCPGDRAPIQQWSGHPRIWLDVGTTGQATCPYCGTQYRLQPGEVFHRGH